MEKRTIITLAVCLLGLAGCAESDDMPRDNRIVLSMQLPAVESAASRAPVDGWNETPVSVGYVIAPGTLFDRSLTIPVGDNAAGQHVNTGLAYPEDNSVVRFVGYHPVARPNAVGTVTYDISKGNHDVMISNSVSGSLGNTILSQGGKLVFEHMLTRVTFRLQCAPGQSYPEPIYGLHAMASGSKSLNTAVTFDLAAEELTFKITGMVFAGDIEGFVIPPFGIPPVVVEMMLQPDVPLAFNVSSLTGDRNITNISDPDGHWAKLTTQGGERGKQYTVLLSFSGVVILAQDIAVTPWKETSGQYLGGAQTWW